MKIRDGYQNFRSTSFPQHAELFDQLKNGQSPEVLLITCSDSRIDPALITQTLPGDLFVIRNAGNLVPTRSASGVAATLEYGVKALKVKHIVVCGHSHCGAVAAALEPESLEPLPYVAAWLNESGPKLPEFTETGPEKLTAAVQYNVLRQLDNLRALPFVSAAVEAGELELHGWVYEFENGSVTEFDGDTSTFTPLGESAPVAV